MNPGATRAVAFAVCMLLATVVAACAATTTSQPPSPIITSPPTALATAAATRANPTNVPATGAPASTTPVPAATPSSTALEFNFDKDPVGGPPAGATVFSGAWAVRVEPGAPSEPNALCQTATATFPALSLLAQKFADVSVSVRFKPISGNTDRAAGIIFRIQDKDNYYIVRANALEDNVNLYKYVNGQRIDIKDGSGKVASGKWQELRVEVAGNRIRGFLEGQPVVETTDGTYQTGGVGLWTKADSTTCFDNVRIEAR